MKLLLALLLSLSATFAQASIVTYKFTGIFGTPDRMAFEPHDDAVFLGLLSEGERFSGSFSFDSAADPLYSTAYPLMDFRLGASDRFNAALSGWTPDYIQVNDYPAESGLSDGLALWAASYIDGFHTMSAMLHLDALDGAAFQDDRLPVGFDEFSSARLHLFLYHNDGFVYDVVLSQISVQLDDSPSVAVPEPSSGLLLLAGLGAIASRRRRPQAH